MLRTNIISNILLVLSVILAVIAIVGTLALLINFSKGGVYVEAGLSASEIGIAALFGYINLLFASLCFAQYLLVGGRGNSKIAGIARMTLLYFGYSAFLLSIVAAALVCFLFMGRDFLVVRVFMAFIYPFILGVLCVGLSSGLLWAKKEIS